MGVQGKLNWMPGICIVYVGIYRVFAVSKLSFSERF